MEASTVTTPSAPPAMPPAAPATSAPSQEIAPGQRPTFEQVFAQQDAALATPETPVQPEAATTPPTEPPAPESVHPSTKEGPIPFAVHKTALENARTKERETVQAEFDRDYGWMRGAPREQWTRMAEIAQELSNPPAFLDKYFKEAANDPTHGPAVKSWAAKTLASRQGHAPDLSPDVSVFDAAGAEVAKTFSADRVQAIVQHAVQEALGKEVAPLKQDWEQRKASEKQQADAARAAESAKQLDAHTDAVLADISELLDITEQTPKADKDALFTELGALLEADKTLTPHKAAMQLRKTRIVPALDGKAKQAVLDDLHKKAAAQGLNPAGAVTAPTHRPKSFYDPSLKW